MKITLYIRKRKKQVYFFYFLRLSKILFINNPHRISCGCAHVCMGRHTECLCMQMSPYIWMPKQVCTWHHVYREVTRQLSEVCFLLLVWDPGTQVWWQSSLSDMHVFTQWTIPRTWLLYWLYCSFSTLNSILVPSWFSNIIFWHQATYHYPYIELQKTEKSEMKMNDCRKNCHKYFF